MSKATVKFIAKKLLNNIKLLAVRFREPGRPEFTCSLCAYHGVFLDNAFNDHKVCHSICPNCLSFERHRLQKLVLGELEKEYAFSSMSILHVAPEYFFQAELKKKFKKYESVDLTMKDVDYHADLCNLPMKNNSYDCVLASHVLEHIKDDEKALQEIHRVLTPGGIAILPVPVTVEKTVEYPKVNWNEWGHVRAPGPDYFDRYRRIFSDCKLYSSSDFPKEHQIYIYEDRTAWPNKKMPYLTPMDGVKHLDYVPVCLKALS